MYSFGLMTIENVHNIKEAFNCNTTKLVSPKQCFIHCNCSIYADVFSSSTAQSLSPSDGAFFRASVISLFCGSQKEANWLLNAKSDWQSWDKPEGKQVIHFELILINWRKKKHSFGVFLCKSLILADLHFTWAENVSHCSSWPVLPDLMLSLLPIQH